MRFGLKYRHYPTPAAIKKAADAILYGIGGASAIAAVTNYYPHIAGFLMLLSMGAKIVSKYFGGDTNVQ